MRKIKLVALDSDGVLLNDTGTNTRFATVRQTTAGATLTIAAGVAIGGPGGTIGFDSFNDNTPSNVNVVNQGTVGFRRYSQADRRRV